MFLILDDLPYPFNVYAISMNILIEMICNSLLFIIVLCSILVRIGIDSTYPSDEEQFKEDYKIALQTMLSSASSSQVEVQNIQLYLGKSFGYLSHII